MSSADRSEDELGKKWDRCITDTILKVGGGLLIGTTFSLFFFRRRPWPIILGTGIGLGMAYSNCERDLNATLQAVKTPAKEVIRDKSFDKPCKPHEKVQ